MYRGSHSSSRAFRGYGAGRDSVAKNTAASLIAQLTTASLTAVMTIFLVRALGASQYGVFALAVGMGSVTVSLSDLGITFSTARFVAEHSGTDDGLRALIVDALKLKVIATGLVCALLAALASLIAAAYGDRALVWPLRAMALATFGQSTYLMLLGISTARGRATANIRLVAAESLLEITATLALVIAGAGAAGAAFGRAIGYVAGAAIAALAVVRLTASGPVHLWRLPARSTVRRIGTYARSVFAIDASYTLSASASVILLGAYLGSAASGIYQAPLKLITLIQYVGLSTANGVTPMVTRAPGREPDVRALNGALRGLIGFQCLMLAPIVVWARPITHLVLGAGYGRSADVLRALAPFVLFSGLAPLLTGSVNYLGEARRRVPIAMATLAAITLGGVILIPRYGVVGAAVATDIAFGFYTLSHLWLCRRLLQLRIGMLIWSLACGLTAASAMGVILSSVGTGRLTALQWLVGGACGTAAYMAMLAFTREIGAPELRHLRRAIVSGGARSLAEDGALIAPGQPTPSPRSPRAGGLYQIAWEPTARSFALWPVEAGEERNAAADDSPRSPAFEWQWGLPPAPTPAARRAHRALEEELLGAGWQPVGLGDAWFATRFRSPPAHLRPEQHQQPSERVRR